MPALLKPSNGPESNSEEQFARTVSQLTEINNRLTSENAHYKALTEGLMSSLSWRITAPLRAALALLRFLRATMIPPWRNAVYAFHVTPERDVVQRNNTFEITGLNPVLKLESASFPQELLNRGCWSHIAVTCETSSSHQVFFVHPLVGPTVTEHLRITIPAESGRTTSMLASIPARTKGFALEPFGLKGSFLLRSITIQPLGGLQSIYELLRQSCGGRISVGLILAKLSAAWRIFRSGGLVALRAKISPRNFSANYADWVARYDKFTDESRLQCAKALQALSNKPLISVLVPVYNVEERWLRAAIESVLAQVYTNWELCIADDCSTAPHIASVLKEYAQRDARIKITFRSQNGHIVAATNSALELATGEYIAFLDNDDELTPDALACVAFAINQYPSGELFYSDEDKKTEGGQRFNPYFKSDWNPELLLSQNYLCHLCVYRTATVRKLHGMRVGFEGAQDWDLALRVADSVPVETLHHIPHILYHWRVIAGSTAQSTSNKPYVLAAQQKAVSEHLIRRNIVGAVVAIDETISQLKVKLPIPAHKPLISIVIPTKDRIDLLSTFIDSVIDKSTYRNFEFVIIDNGSVEAQTSNWFSELKNRWPATTIIRDDGAFNYARLNNRAVASATGEYLLLCNNDLEVISPDWLDQLLGFACLPSVGAVGARLLYPNGSVQHAGVVTGINGVAGHAFKGFPRHDVGYFNAAILPRTVSACTAACLMMKRKEFIVVGGFDEKHLAVAFNDVDLCLKLSSAGQRIIYCPYAELFHYESASRGFETTPEKFLRFEGEVATMKTRWADRLPNDPYYNPNLTMLTEDYVFAFPPRRVKPWA